MKILNEEEKIENIFMGYWRTHRDEQKLLTKFDNNLSHILSIILSKYETSRAQMISLDSSEFKQLVKNNIEDNCEFKTFPIQFQHKDPRRMFEAILNNEEVGKTVIQSNGDRINLAVRCKIVPYPEEIFAVWIVVASYYIVI